MISELPSLICYGDITPEHVIQSCYTVCYTRKALWVIYFKEQ